MARSQFKLLNAVQGKRAGVHHHAHLMPPSISCLFTNEQLYKYAAFSFLYPEGDWRRRQIKGPRERERYTIFQSSLLDQRQAAFINLICNKVLQ